jgi:hypothetical protein
VVEQGGAVPVLLRVAAVAGGLEHHVRGAAGRAAARVVVHDSHALERPKRLKDLPDLILAQALLEARHLQPQRGLGHAAKQRRQVARAAEAEREQVCVRRRGCLGCLRCLPGQVLLGLCGLHHHGLAQHRLRCVVCWCGCVGEGGGGGQETGGVLCGAAQAAARETLMA